MMWQTEAAVTAANMIQTKSEACFSEAVSLLGALCEIDSGTGNRNGNLEMVKRIDTFLEEIPLSSEHIEGEYGIHMVIRINPQAEGGPIVLSAHTDTVFGEGDAARYPFHTEGDLAYGLGSSDCKGGVVVILYALKILKDCGLLPDKKILVIFNCDEEKGSPDSRRLFAKICTDAECAMVFEPSREENGILTSRMGGGRALLEVFGKQAHAAKFREGASAAEGLARTIVRMMDFNCPETNLYFNVGPIRVPTASNIVAPYASAEVAFRLNEAHPFAEVSRLLKSLEGAVDPTGCTVKVTVTQSFPPMDRTEGNVWLYEHVKHVGEWLGMRLPEQATVGSGDANLFSGMGIPVICGMGSYTYGPHVPDEKTSLTSLKERICLAALALATY